MSLFNGYYPVSRYYCAFLQPHIYMRLHMERTCLWKLLVEKKVVVDETTGIADLDPL